MPKFATVAFDSASELARLYFSKTMGKSSKDYEAIRSMQDYPGTTERLNMVIRRLKNLRNAGTEIVFTAHEDIQKVYSRGGAMAKKGERPQEPVSVKGQPDMPGNRTPDEFCRAADNVLRVRHQNRQPVAVAVREPLGAGGDYWEVKDRFNATKLGAPPGILPLNYQGIKTLAETAGFWPAPFIWILYGPFGIGKTRSLLTFPRPIKIYDLDLGTKSIEYDVKKIRAEEGDGSIVIEPYDVEDIKSYEPFMASIANLF